MRYQQGIGTPETLGVQPTLWQEPKMFTPKALSFPTLNAGTSRNYGDAGKYVDTMPSRWGSPSGLTMTPRRARLGIQGLEELLGGTSPSITPSPITTPSTSRTMARNGRGQVDPNERRGMYP